MRHIESHAIDPWSPSFSLSDFQHPLVGISTTAKPILTMAPTVLQSVFRYGVELLSTMLINHSGPIQYGFKKVTVESIIDKTYAIVLASALCSSLLVIWLSDFVSRDPVIAKDAIKPPRFRLRERNGLETYIENENGVDYKKKNATPEQLIGWRLRLGVIQSVVLFGLLSIHSFILVTEAYSVLRGVFVVYWVRPDGTKANQRALSSFTIHLVFFQLYTGDYCTTSCALWELFH